MVQYFYFDSILRTNTQVIVALYTESHVYIFTHFFSMTMSFYLALKIRVKNKILCLQLFLFQTTYSPTGHLYPSG
jgi:hypothetical protein